MSSANLTPAYLEAQERFRKARTTPEKVAILEEMIALLPKHKGTDKIHGQLKRRLSKLRADPGRKKGAGRRGAAFVVDSEGAGQVVLVGAPNTGKSALVSILTKAAPEVSEAPHTTRKPAPGMMSFENVQIQLVDTPSLNRDFVEPLLFDLIRRADLVAVMLDLTSDPLGQLSLVMEMLAERGVTPVEEGEEPTLFKKKLFVVVNKWDDEGLDEDLEIFRELAEVKLPLIAISAKTKRNLEGFIREVFEMLEVIRVYTRAPGKDPDMTAPFVLARGATVEDLAGKIHKDFKDKLRATRLWGSSAFDGQMVPKEHVLSDGDIVEIRM